MIVYDSNVCPTLILTAMLGEMLQFTMGVLAWRGCTQAIGVHVCFHNRRLYILKSFLYAEVLMAR